MLHSGVTAPMMWQRSAESRPKHTHTHTRSKMTQYTYKPTLCVYVLMVGHSVGKRFDVFLRVRFDYCEFVHVCIANKTLPSSAMQLKNNSFCVTKTLRRNVRRLNAQAGIIWHFGCWSVWCTWLCCQSTRVSESNNISKYILDGWPASRLAVEFEN